MARKDPCNAGNPWLSMIDSAVRNHRHQPPESAPGTATSVWLAYDARADAQLALLASPPGALMQRLKKWRPAGLSAQPIRAQFSPRQWVSRVSQQTAQTSDDALQVHERMAALQRIHQRLRAQPRPSGTAPAEDSLDVALRIAEKRRARRSEQ